MAIIGNLKSRIIMQFAVVITPIALILLVQSILEMKNSQLISEYSLAYDLAVDAKSGYHEFVNGVTLAVDTGNLGSTAIEALRKVNKDVKELDAVYPSRDTDKISQEIETLLEAVVSNPSIDALIPLRNSINHADKAISEAVTWRKGEHARIHSEAIQNANTQSMIVMVATLITLMVAVYFIHRMIVSLTRPLAIAINMADKIAEGDLGSEIEVSGGSEMGQLLRSLNIMNANLRKIVGGVQMAANAMAASSAKLAIETDDVMDRANTQSGGVIQVGTAMEEMSASAAEVANSAAGTAEAAMKAQHIVNVSTSSMAKNMEITARVVAMVKLSSGSVGELNAEIQKIGEISSVIKEIAEQTNLLALNAAIEAARAGEQGRGFAVVADEVKKLAGRTNSSTVAIANIVKTIEQRTQAVVEAMGRVSLNVEEGAKDSRATSDMLQQIVVAANQVTDLAKHIEGAVKEQSSASVETAANIEKFSTLTRENTASIESVRHTTKDLANTAIELQHLVGQFKLRP